MIVAIHNYSWMVGKGVRVSGTMREYQQTESTRFHNGWTLKN